MLPTAVLRLSKPQTLTAQNFEYLLTTSRKANYLLVLPVHLETLTAYPCSSITRVQR